MGKTGGRLALSAAAGALLLGAGIASMSGGPTASPPSPSSVEELTFSQTCLLQRIGGQFTRCDNLSGGVQAPGHVPRIQRMGRGDFR